MRRNDEHYFFSSSSSSSCLLYTSPLREPIEIFKGPLSATATTGPFHQIQVRSWDSMRDLSKPAKYLPHEAVAAELQMWSSAPSGSDNFIRVFPSDDLPVATHLNGLQGWRVSNLATISIGKR